MQSRIYIAVSGDKCGTVITPGTHYSHTMSRVNTGQCSVIGFSVCVYVCLFVCLFFFFRLFKSQLFICYKLFRVAKAKIIRHVNSGQYLKHLAHFYTEKKLEFIQKKASIMSCPATSPACVCSCWKYRTSCWGWRWRGWLCSYGYIWPNMPIWAYRHMGIYVKNMVKWGIP